MAAAPVPKPSGVLAGSSRLHGKAHIRGNGVSDDLLQRRGGGGADRWGLVLHLDGPRGEAGRIEIDVVLMAA